MAEKLDPAKVAKAAKILSQLGASKGGRTRSENMTPEQRREAAANAARAKWAKAKADVLNRAIENARVNWNEDVQTRKETLDAFARTTGASVREGNFVWASGCYLLLHFDLIVASDDDTKRSETYQAIEETVIRNNGTKLGGSVYAVPMLADRTSIQSAAEFWNTLCADLGGTLPSGGLLTYGDSFFLHYAPDAKNRLGGIAQVVSSKKGLTKVKIPST